MSDEIPSGCDYDVWGADFGAQAGTGCLNSDPAHQDAHHAADAPIELCERAEAVSGG